VERVLGDVHGGGLLVGDFETSFVAVVIVVVAAIRLMITSRFSSGLPRPLIHLRPPARVPGLLDPPESAVIVRLLASG